MTSKTVGNTLDGLVSRLEKTSDTPGLDAQVLLARLLDKPRSWVMAHPEVPLTDDRSATLETLVARLEGGEPLPYVLGCWEFFGLEFEITPDVLIPRPETELLVERAIAWLRKLGAGSRELRGMDVGTGSGCIAIALAVNMPELRIIATDISPGAIKVARRNAAKHGVTDRVEFRCCDLFPFPSTANRHPSTVDLIVANLPYIPTPTLNGLPVYRREPTMALDGGADGLDLIRRLLTEAPEHLAPGGMMLLEIEASEGQAVLSLARAAFAKTEIQMHQDLSGHDRLVEVKV
jgi:release factor glutamine methyltransferase